MALKIRPDGKIDVRVTAMVAGQLVEVRRRGCLTKGDARRVEQELEAELLLLKQNGRPKVTTWQQALEEFYLWKEKKIAYSTFSSMKLTLEAHTEVWKERPIESFLTAEIESLIEDVYDEEAVESKRKLLRYLREVFKRKIQQGKLAVNPCGDLSYGKKARKELIAMNRTETHLLLGEAKRIGHPWYPIWRVVYELGLRSGEGLALKWTDVDFTNNRISINKSYCSKSKKVGPTKNKKTRTLPLNPSMVVFLKELKLASSDSEHILPQLTDWKRGEAAEILRTFQRDLKIRETNFHSLRASFITHLLLVGVPVTKVQQMVGHADLKTTQDYVRLVASDLNGATDALALDLPDDKLADVLPMFSET